MKKLTPFLLFVTFSAGLEAAQLPVVLGSAGNFSVLGASTVTNTGPTTVVGELGVSPGTAITGFPPGQVTGGSIHSADGPAGLAQGDLTTAFNDAAGRVIPAIVGGRSRWIDFDARSLQVDLDARHNRRSKAGWPRERK